MADKNKLSKRDKNRKFFHYNFFTKNRKGDIPITILVIGVLIICALAIFSFFSSVIKMSNSFVGIGLTEKMNSQIEERTFNGQSPNGLYLENKITKGILFWKKEIILFSVEYKFKP